MSQRNPTEAIIRNIRSTMTVTGATEAKVAEAADMSLADLNARLNGVDEFTVAEIVHVGGFLHLTPTELLTEAA